MTFDTIGCNRTLVLLILLLGFGVSTGSWADEKPNIIVILADDVGWGDLSCYGATGYQTPHLDALADQGIRFTNGYSSASTCTPTRYSLLTGTYAFRIPGTGIAPPNSPALIQPGTETVASLLKRANYQTAVVGKWHLVRHKSGQANNGELRLVPTTMPLLQLLDLQQDPAEAIDLSE